MCHVLLSGGFWPTPPAVWPSELPNFCGECPRPCSQGMTRSQNQGDSYREKIRVIPLWEWSGGHSRKTAPESFGAMLWCGIVLKRPGTFFWSASVPRATMRQRECHLDIFAGSISSPWSTKKRRILPDSVTASQIITEAAHWFLVTIRDPSSPFPDPTRSFWVIKWCSTSNFFSSLKTRNAGKKNLVFLESFINNLSRKVLFLDMLEWRHLQVLSVYSWHGPIRHSRTESLARFCMDLLGFLLIFPLMDVTSSGVLAVRGRLCLAYSECPQSPLNVLLSSTPAFCSPSGSYRYLS